MKLNQIIEVDGARWRVHRVTALTVTLRHAGSHGADIKKWRLAKKLTTRQAAPLLGISQGQLTRIENGTRTCPGELLSKIKSEATIEARRVSG